MATSSTADTKRPAFSDHNVLRWLVGYGAGLLGDQIYFISMAWTITHIASPAQSGLILAAGAVPRAMFMLMGGALVDRYGPKRVALLSAVARVLVVACVTSLLLVQPENVFLLVGLTIVFGVVDALFIPAAGSLPRYVVVQAELGRVQGMRSLLQRMALVAGPPIAGFVIAGYGVAAALVLAVLQFVISAWALRMTTLRISELAEAGSLSRTGNEAIPAPVTQPSGRTGLLTEVLDGLRYVRSHRVLLPMLVVTAVGEIAATGPIAVSLPLLVSARGWGVEGLGTIMAGFGIGAMTTALLITLMGGIPRAGYIALSSVVVMGPALAIVGLSNSMVGAAIAGCVAGLGGGICSTLISTFALSVTEKSQLGRVIGLMGLATFGGAPISYAASGFIVSLTNPSAPFVVSGLALAIVGGAALCVPALRSVEMPRTASR